MIGFPKDKTLLPHQLITQTAKERKQGSHERAGIYNKLLL